MPHLRASVDSNFLALIRCTQPWTSMCNRHRSCLLSLFMARTLKFVLPVWDLGLCNLVKIEQLWKLGGGQIQTVARDCFMTFSWNTLDTTHVAGGLLNLRNKSTAENICGRPSRRTTERWWRKDQSVAARMYARCFFDLQVSRPNRSDTAPSQRRM